MQINKSQIQELVNELNDLYEIDCRVDDSHGELIVVVDEPNELDFAQQFIGEYSDIIVELPMLVNKQ